MKKRAVRTFPFEYFGVYSQVFYSHSILLLIPVGVCLTSACGRWLLPYFLCWLKVCHIQHPPQISIWQREHSWVSLNFYSVFNYFHSSFLHPFNFYNSVLKMFRVEIFLGFQYWSHLKHTYTQKKDRIKRGSYLLLPCLAIASCRHFCWVASLLWPQILYGLVASSVFSPFGFFHYYFLYFFLQHMLMCICQTGNTTSFNGITSVKNSY